MKNYIEDAPVSNVQWVHRDTLSPVAFNPNRVAPAEMRLLKISIMENGFTQPIVITPDNVIVDGSHRWLTAKDKDVMKRYNGMVPVVALNIPSTKDHQMATIRHNRARGTHGVLDMSKIVQGMVESDTPVAEIMERLQMEEEEVIRLASRVGIPKSKLITDKQFSNAWEPQ